MKSFKSFIAILAITTAAIHAAVIDNVEINEITRLHYYDLMDNYATAILELKNMGPKTATVELLLDVSSPSCSSSSNSSAQKHIELPPGSTVVTQLEVPPNYRMARVAHSAYGSYFIPPRKFDLNATVNGRHTKFPLALISATWTVGAMGLHLFSPSLTISPYEKLLPPNDNYNTKAVLENASRPIQSWPTKHKDYEGIAAIWISSKDNLPPQVENAIHGYVRLGGTLVIVIPPDTPRPKDIPKEGKTQKLMSGQIITFQPYDKQLEPLVMDYGKKLEEVAEDRFNIEEDYPDLPNELKHDAGIKRLIELLTTPLKEPFTIHRPIPESPVPLMQLLIVMAIFAILVGPLPYFALRPQAKDRIDPAGIPCDLHRLLPAHHCLHHLQGRLGFKSQRDSLYPTRPNFRNSCNVRGNLALDATQAKAGFPLQQ